MAREKRRPPTKREKQPELPPGVSLRHTLTGHRGRVRSVAVSGDGRRAVSGSNDRTLKLWDLESGAACRTLPDPIGTARAVALSADGRQTVWASSDWTLKVWNLERGEEAAQDARP